MRNQIEKYSHLVSPFNQSKILAHQSVFEHIEKETIVPPITCEIDLTDGFCNNRCAHCFFGTNQKSAPIYNDIELLKKTITDLKEMGTKGIEFSGGGEPTTHPQCKEIIQFCLDLGLDVGLVTNGLLLDKINDVAPRLKFIRISLDAGTSDVYHTVHGVDVFDRVIKNIKSIIELGADNVGIGYLIVPQNVNNIEAAFDLAKGLGVRYLQYRPASLVDAVDENIWKEAHKRIQSILKLDSNGMQVFDAGIKWSHLNHERNYEKCYTSTLVSVIKANGDVPLCVLKRNEKDSIIGNIRDGFKNIWYSERHLNLINNNEVKCCRKPCKHDSYNIMFEASRKDFLHKNFI